MRVLVPITELVTTELMTTELVTMENLFVFQEGYAWQDVLDGVYDADGRVSYQIGGGLKGFGHPHRRERSAHD